MCRPNADELYVFDRREGDLFVLVSDSGREMVVDSLPEDARTGDALRCTERGWVLWPDETKARRARIGEKKKSLFRRGSSPQGPKGV